MKLLFSVRYTDLVGLMHNLYRNLARVRGARYTYMYLLSPTAGGSCFSAGTRITIASGEEMTIEKQMFGQKLVSNAGDITTITNEYVENEIESGGQLFGINNDEPFATPNHPFWTTEGWKSLEPEAAREENPHISYGVLQIGDTVFRITQTYPLLYEPVTISQFTIITFSEPSKTYGLHLNGPQSYHANRYVVAANYPILTKKRVQDGKKKLSGGEKENLVSAIGSGGKEVMKVLGKWASAFLDEGLVDRKPIAENQ